MLCLDHFKLNMKHVSLATEVKGAFDVPTSNGWADSGYTTRMWSIHLLYAYMSVDTVQSRLGLEIIALQV